jgi:hypothetical protein
MAASTPSIICNVALGYLGNYQIDDITTPRNAIEKICAFWYKRTKRACLREFLLNESIAAIRIAESTDTPVTDWSYLYELPADNLRVLSIGDYRLNSWGFENGKLACDLSAGEDGLLVRYVKDIGEENLNDSFIEYLGLRLAYNMCYQITKKSDLVVRIKEMMDMAEGRVSTAEGRENKPVIVNNSKYKNARYSGEHPYKRYKV